MSVLKKIEEKQLRDDIADFKVGDTVQVHVRLKEGDKERIQIFEGTVIRKRGGGLRASFTVRKISYGIGVERTFPLHSPMIKMVKVTYSGRVRRSKLYYLRGRTGKAAKVAEAKKIW